MEQPEAPTISPEAMALAEEAAAKDLEFLAAAQARIRERKQEPITIETDDPDFDVETPRVEVHMNRAERRQAVKNYAKLLQLTERQTPIVNATIVPKSKRRRRPGQKGRLQHV